MKINTQLPEEFVGKLLSFAQTQDRDFCFLENLQGSTEHTDFEKILGIAGDQRETLQNTDLNTGKWRFGLLSFNLKNQFENLRSIHADNIGFPDSDFFTPEILIKIKGQEVTIESDRSEPEEIFKQILSQPSQGINKFNIQLSKRSTRENYLSKVDSLLNHIHRGDIYEINFCQEFYAENVSLDPVQLYMNLRNHTPMPFSGMYRKGESFLLCASPERFLKKTGNRLISQPIKGTKRRMPDETQDRLMAEQLRNDEKERAENIMIVDLVRNDLSRIAIPGTVKVDELCGIYTFSHVHQMISTVSCQISNEIKLSEIIKATFPMGSMTGAPKIRALELIEKYEDMNRGLYSGSIGFIDPQGDFDFNVVIRSLQYNRPSGYLSLMVGGAITSGSQPEKEYEECLLKAEAVRSLLNAELKNA